MDKKFLFRIFLLILALLASILACLVTLLVFSLSNASENERLSENESRSENKSRSEYESRIVCGIVPYQGLNPWTVQVVTQNGSAGKICGGSFRQILKLEGKYGGYAGRGGRRKRREGR